MSWMAVSRSSTPMCTCKPKIRLARATIFMSSTLARGVHKAQFAAVVIERPVRAHQAHEHGREIRERPDLLAELFHLHLEPIQRALRNPDRFGKFFQNAIAMRGPERFVDSARHHPGRMDALARQPFDDLLAELAQADSVARDGRVRFHHPEDVAL